MTAPVVDPLTTPAPQPWVTSRTVRNAAGLIIAASALARFIMGLQGFFVLDDFVFIARSARPDALSPTALMERHMGHLNPGGDLLTWATTRIAPFDHALPVVLMSGGWLLCLLLMYRLLVRWLGTTPIVLLPLALYASTPLTVQTTTWWSAAINSLPLQISSLWIALAVLPMARGARTLSWKSQASIIAACIVAAVFFEKWVLLLLLAFGLVVVWSPRQRAIASAWRAAWATWLVLLVLAAAYAAIYLVISTTDEVGVPPPQPIESIQRVGIALTRGLIPSLIGGPVTLTPGPDPWPVPSLWLVGVAVSASILAIILIVDGSVQTRRLGILALTYAAACLAAPAVGRVDFLPESSAALRYFVEAAVPLTLLSASIAVDRCGRWPRRATAVPWAIGCAAVLLVSATSVATLAGYWTVLSDITTRPITQRALTSLASVDPERPLLDVAAPGTLLSPLYGRYSESSLALGPAPRSPGFAAQATVLRVWSDDGRLLPARVEGPSARGTGSCPWPIPPGQVITLTGPLVYFRHVVSLTTSAPADTSLLVSLGDGPASEWSVPAGRATAFQWQVGGGSDTVTVSAPPGAGPACVVSIAAGAPVPLGDGN